MRDPRGGPIPVGIDGNARFAVRVFVVSGVVRERRRPAPRLAAILAAAKGDVGIGAEKTGRLPYDDRDSVGSHCRVHVFDGAITHPAVGMKTMGRCPCATAVRRGCKSKIAALRPYDETFAVG